jgi:PKD repeat protein
MKYTLTTLGILLSFTISYGQQKKDYAALAEENNQTFQEIQTAFKKNWEGRDHKVKAKGWKVFKRWEYFHQSRVAKNGTLVNHAAQNFQEYSTYFGHKQSSASAKTSSGSAMAAGNWTYIGPPGGISTFGGAGRTTFIRFHPLNSSIMYTGSPAGGLWISVNGGTSWTVMADQIASLGCSDLVIDPTNASVMYLATGDADAKDTYSIGVLKSTDGGVTWNTTGLIYTVQQSATIAKLLIHPTNPQILYAATTSGIMKTLDGGINWFVVKTGGGFKDIEFKPFNPNTIYATASGGFFKSTNGGATWTTTPTSFPGSVGRSCISVTPADSNYVYILGSTPGTGSADDYGYEGIVRSTNGGQTFTIMSSSPNILGWNTSGTDQGGQGWYDLALAVSPTNKDVLFTGGVNIWKSLDGGVTMTNCSNWWGSGTGYAHADQHAIEFLPGSGTTVFAANDGGVFKTSNTGSAWTDMSSGLHIAQQYNLGVSQTNSALTLTGWQDNGTNLHNGTACEEVLGGDGFECIISWSNASEMYGELYYGDINKSTNGGASFSNIVSSGGTGVDEDGAWNTPFIQHPTNASTLLVGKSEVYRSTNGGNSWSQVGSISGNGLLSRLAYAPSNPNYIYVTDGNGLWVSTDGATFTNKSSLLPGADITGFAIDPANPDIVYVSSSGYNANDKVFVTSDAGNTWQNYSTGLPNVPCNHIVFEPSADDKLYLATDIGVFYRDSSMANWIAYSDGMPNVVVTELEIQTATGKLRASTYGRGLWETDLYTAPTSAPVAAFMSNMTSACKSKPINFYDQSTNLPSSWNWTFTGGTPATSTLQYPIISYANAGTYPVKMVVSNAAGADSISYTSYITIHPTPVVSSSNDTTICKGDTIQISASGGIQYTWATSTTLSNLFVANPLAWPNVTKVHNVTVSDTNGCKATTQVIVYVIQPFANPSITASDSLLTASPSGGNLLYQWYYNGSAINGATAQTLIVDSAGNYTVVVSDTSGCFSVSSAPLVFVGMSEASAAGNWNFYPNPSDGNINVTCNSAFNGNVLIRLYNSEGKLVVTENRSVKQGDVYQLKNDLSAGIYYLDISDNDGNLLKNGKIIVVKN